MSVAGLEAPRPLSAPAAGPATRRDQWVDRFLGSDPGLNRFRNALESVVTIGAILAVERLFIHLTHALQIQTHGAALPAAKAAVVAAANHQFLVIGMMLGAVVGMISVFGVSDATGRGQLTTMLLIPVPMIPMLILGIELGGHRVTALALIAVILAVGTYCRRFGPRGFLGGMLLFLGNFLGFFLHGAIKLGDIGWLIAELGLGLAVAIAVRFLLFRPRPRAALRRTQRSYAARARKAAALALELFDDPEHSDRDARRLHRQLVRLNEAALMIDAQLGDPAAVADGSSAQLLHQRLFDVELALTNVARFAQAMTRLDLPDDQRSEIRLALLDLVRRDAGWANAHAERLIALLHAAGAVPAGQDRSAVVVPHRFAGSVIALTDAMTEWLALGASEAGTGTFQPSVMLFAGWLPGSAQTSALASLERGARPGGRIRLAPYTRTAIQMGIAVGLAIILGDIVSGRRYYWAVIAAFITFMGANNSGEQTRKALQRVGGTLVGIGVGSLLAHAVGHDTYLSIAVILVALFFAFYLMRINYAFMVIGITVMVSQLYVQLDEFSNSLLWLRLEETALGAVVAIAVTTFVLPLRTRRVLRIALRAHVQAVAQLVEHASDRLTGDHHRSPAALARPGESVPGSDAAAGGEAGARAGRAPRADATLRADARAVDASYQALFATAQPMRRTFVGGVDEATGQVMRLASASRHYSRNLVGDVETAGRLDVDTRRDVKGASATLHESLDVIAAALNGPRDGTYIRSSALFDRAERRLEERPGLVDEGQLAIRDLKLIDGAMAGLAESMGLTVTDYDTVALR